MNRRTFLTGTVTAVAAGAATLAFSEDPSGLLVPDRTVEIAEPTALVPDFGLLTPGTEIYIRVDMSPHALRFGFHRVGYITGMEYSREAVPATRGGDSSQTFLPGRISFSGTFRGALQT